MMTLGEFKDKFDSTFSQFFDSKLQEIALESPHLRSTLESSRNMWIEGGKRIRPYLCMLAYTAYGGEDIQAILYAGMSLELLHVFALVHDDIIDQSETRRGYETLHVLLARQHEKQALHGDPKHAGESLAVLIGDLLFSYANEIVTHMSFPKDRVVSAQKLFYTIQQQLVLGEYEDVQVTSQLRGVTEQHVLTLMSKKSGRYSIEQPLQFGMLLAGQTEKFSQVAFKQFSEPLGIAFQLHDDMLGTFGDERAMGKPTDSDIRQGKPTLMVVHSLMNASGATKDRLLSILGNQKAPAKDIGEARQILRSTKSDVYAKKKAAEYITQAHTALRNMKQLPKELSAHYLF